MTTQTCDICGKQTYLNPKSENIEIKDIEGNITGYETDEILVQNPNSGEMEKIKVSKLRDLQERTYKVMLFCGQENIVKDFCLNCLNTHKIGEEIRGLFNSLMNITSK